MVGVGVVIGRILAERLADALRNRLVPSQVLQRAQGVKDRFHWAKYSE